jgi:hypothetical protein
MGKAMLDILELILACRSAGTLPAALNARIDQMAGEIIASYDSFSRAVLEREFLEEGE